MRVPKLILLLCVPANCLLLQCAPGSYSTGSACVSCTAGYFSYLTGSTACQACPAYTGSAIGSSACVVCSALTACRMASGASCSSCVTACAVCAAGTYSPVGDSCTQCGAGTYSTGMQATSVETCLTCDSGTTTGPTDKGLTTCASCASLGQPLPLHAGYLDTPSDPLVCSWACNAGYISVNYSEATFSSRAYTTIGYTVAEAPQIFHASKDYCCSPTLANAPGTYLVGCNRTFDGALASCPPVANGYFLMAPTPKLNRCGDWACNGGYYTNGTACLMQPACAVGYTFQRDNVTGSVVPSSTGVFVCVPCSQCQRGSEVLTPCNRTIDTVCVQCGPTSFSISGSVCLSTPPVGYIGVIMQLTAAPPFQGRPMFYSDASTLIDWSSITKGGFFINTYTKCQSIPSYQVYSGNDVPCRRSDVQTQLCQLPSCNWQCRPWNGTAGWYMLRGQCAACAYDTTCTETQYSNLAVCGPLSAPVCTPCPSLPLPNALGWINPGRLSTPYPCTPVCRNGYRLNSNGSSCIFCPSLPNNSKVIGGDCAWACSLGFRQSGASLCVPCTGVPTSCQRGTFLGYADGSQCAQCLPCTNTVANSIYTTAGVPNGPNTCRLTCNPGYFVDPAYGFDAFDNPVACGPCSRPTCVRGVSFLIGCTYTADAYCNTCSVCSIGKQILTPCSTGSDTVCTGCDPSLLPANAMWTAAECTLWACNAGFYSDGGCTACKQPSDCRISDRYGYADNIVGCGICTPCNASLLLPWQCFNGDGQCGKTYWCGYTTTSVEVTTTVTTTPIPTTTVVVPTTTAAPITTPYATLLTLTLAANASLSNLTRYIVCQPACSVRILSVTRGNVTTYYRRLLSTTVVIDIGIVSPRPAELTVLGSLNPIALVISQSFPVTNSSVLDNPLQFAVFVRSMSPAADENAVSMGIIYGAVGVYGVMMVVVIVCCYMRRGKIPAEKGAPPTTMFDQVKIND